MKTSMKKEQLMKAFDKGNNIHVINQKHWWQANDPKYSIPRANLRGRNFMLPKDWKTWQPYEKDLYCGTIISFYNVRL